MLSDTEIIKFSIIVPAYNVETYIGECLESLSRQTYKNFEVIVVDDGSVDRTACLAKYFVDRDHRFHLFYQPNLGSSSARNTGIELSTGSYILFVDSDDWVSEDLLANLFCSINDYSADLIIFGLKFYENGKFFKRSVLQTRDAIPGRDYFVEALERDEFSQTVCNKVFKKELIYNLKFLQIIKFEDLHFSIISLLNAKTVSTIDSSFYFYRKNRKGSKTTVVNSDDVSHLSTTIECLLKDIMKAGSNNILENKTFINDIAERVYKEIFVKFYDGTNFYCKSEVIKELCTDEIIDRFIRFYIREGRYFSIRVALFLFKINPIIFERIGKFYFYLRQIVRQFLGEKQ